MQQKIMAAVVCIGTMALTASVNAEHLDKPRLIFTTKKRVGSDDSIYVFKLYKLESSSNYWYRVDVSDENTPKVLQSEKIRNGVPLDGKASFQIVDVNSDGYTDIKILGGHNKNKAWFKIWLYDASKRTFVWSRRNA